MFLHKRAYYAAGLFFVFFLSLFSAAKTLLSPRCAARCLAPPGEETRRFSHSLRGEVLLRRAVRREDEAQMRTPHKRQTVQVQRAPAKRQLCGEEAEQGSGRMLSYLTTEQSGLCDAERRGIFKGVCRP